MYCLHLLFLFLLFLHGDALACIFSFGLPEFFFLSTCPCVRPACAALRVGLAVVSCSLAGFEAMFNVLCRIGRRRCAMRLVGISSVEGFACGAPPSNHGHHLSTFKAYRPLYLPVVNLAPRWEGGMVGVRNERQTHLPTPPVWTAPLRSSLSSPSRGIVARVLWEESSFSGTLLIS